VSDSSFVAGEPPVSPPPTGSKRWFVWLFASEGLNYLSYLALAPVIVSYAVFALGTLGVVVVSGMEANRSLVEAMLAPLLWLDAQYPWIGWVYNDEQTFRANALRVFGMVSVVGYLGRTIWVRARGRAPVPLLFGARLRRAARRLGVFTAVLVVVMAGAVMTAPWAENPPLWQVVLQSVGISALMGGLLFAASLPALVLSYGLREARTYVGRWMSR